MVTITIVQVVTGQQYTPLYASLTKPAAAAKLAILVTVVIVVTCRRLIARALRASERYFADLPLQGR